MRREDVIDSRSLSSRLEELEKERSGLDEAVEALETQLAFAQINNPGDTEAIETLEEEIATARDAVETWDASEEAAEAQSIKSLEEEVDSGEWKDGLALINKKHWTDYVQEMLEDTGDIPKDFPGYIVIDWDATADNVAQDYATVEWNGDTWYYRAS